MLLEANKIGKTGERMVPELHKGSLIYAEHLIRYMAAEHIIKGKTVLDVASGSGYGTQILSKYAKQVIGVDVSKDAIEYAKKYYSSSNITYKIADGEDIPLDDNAVDVVISFETIEHIKNYKKFLREIARVLKPNGIAIISTPNDLEFAEGNHYHLHEFKYKELTALLSKHFSFIKPYFQATWKYVAIGSEEELNADTITFPTYSYSSPSQKEYLYFYLICSNRQIKEEIISMGALGAHYSDRAAIGIEMTHEKNISDYKKVLENANQKNEDLQNRLTETEKALNRIVNTKPYRLAKKVRRMINIFR